MTLVLSDSKVFKFLNAKVKHLKSQGLKPSKLAWTFLYRKAHKKDKTDEVAKKRRRANKSTVTRSIVGASLEVIQAKRAEKVEVRQLARDTALREIKERARKAKDEKKSKKAAEATKAKAPAAGKPKGGKPKGGKR
eukprot:CAMPEP_0197844132 /NCGR_PEP_ID=MMETSP1438-20131217/1109_1 /TAXON_ID=1461541 /ORGANISM="Pterosperma sp., Strain CCMP1384" /LENGTH=135 /DNA_ID=CAMNT_0043454753 /DNA_START=1785 /DNA_END=2192 /DNA_ORIENTATION=-